VTSGKAITMRSANAGSHAAPRAARLGLYERLVKRHPSLARLVIPSSSQRRRVRLRGVSRDHRDLTLVTRNTRDVAATGVPLVDPWMRS
jgi:hypothetical protein